MMRAAAKAGRRPAMGRPTTADSQPAAAPEASPALPLLPNPHDRLLATERQTAKLLIQNPDLFPDAWDGLTTADFTHPAYAAVFAAVEKAGAELGGAGWLQTPSGCIGCRRPATQMRSDHWSHHWLSSCFQCTAT